MGEGVERERVQVGTMGGVGCERGGVISGQIAGWMWGDYRVAQGSGLGCWSGAEVE